MDLDLVDIGPPCADIKFRELSESRLKVVREGLSRSNCFDRTMGCLTVVIRASINDDKELADIKNMVKENNISDLHIEIIDGNHRYQVMRELNERNPSVCWGSIPVSVHVCLGSDTDIDVMRRCGKDKNFMSQAVGQDSFFDIIQRHRRWFMTAKEKTNENITSTDYYSQNVAAFQDEGQTASSGKKVSKKSRRTMFHYIVKMATVLDKEWRIIERVYNPRKVDPHSPPTNGGFYFSYLSYLHERYRIILMRQYISGTSMSDVRSKAKNIH
eukprot:1335095-Amorphochlora_amoeboformis.AAC.1